MSGQVMETLAAPVVIYDGFERAPCVMCGSLVVIAGKCCSCGEPFLKLVDKETVE